MHLLKWVAAKIDTMNEWVGRGVSWVTTLLVAVVFVDVVMRYLFNTSFVFTQELEWHLFGFIFLIGAGYTLLYDAHVRVDIFFQRLSPRGRAWVNLFGCILFMAPGCFMIFYTSLSFVGSSFAILEGSPDPGGIPFRFILKSCIPAGALLLGLQGISMLIHSLLILTGHEKPYQQEGGAH